METVYEINFKENNEIEFINVEEGSERLYE